MTPIPIGRTHNNDRPTVLHGTWLEPEALACAGYCRRARVILRENPKNAIQLPYGQLYQVHCRRPDDHNRIPARLAFRGTTIPGWITIEHLDTEEARYCFTPINDSKWYVPSLDQEKP